MTDNPRCPIHGDDLYRPLDGGDWVCLAPGCRHRIIEPTNGVDTFTHTEADARRFARSTTDHDPRVGVDGDTYDAAVEEH